MSVKMIGVYAIVNRVNGKKIIGSSQDIHRRWSHYKSTLLKGKYQNKGLQDDFTEFGLDNFEFIILEECTRKKDLSIREKHWIDANWDSGLLYNLNKVNSTHKKVRRGKEAANHKRKFSELNSGENNPNYSGLLSIDDVKQIKTMIQQGLKNREIITHFIDKTTTNMISMIRRGVRYKSVEI